MAPLRKYIRKGELFVVDGETNSACELPDVASGKKVLSEANGPFADR